MNRRHVAPIRAPNEFAVRGAGPMMPLDEIEARRRARLHLPYGEQSRLHKEDLRELPHVEEFHAEWAAFHVAIREQMLKLFGAYGIKLDEEEPPNDDQWRRLAILQAVANREIHITVDGQPLPVRANDEDINKADSVAAVIGRRHAAARHEHIRLIFNERLAAGAPSKSEAARHAIRELQRLYPGEYQAKDWRKVKNICEDGGYPIADATFDYMRKVMAVFAAVEEVAANLNGGSHD